MAGPSSQETREIDIILTFDDGPHAAEASGNFTDRALDVLADNPTMMVLRLCFSFRVMLGIG